MDKVNKTVKVLIIIVFVALSILVANTHEHWSDEAQSFLIARDTSLSEVFEYMKYEGTPALWVLVIKLFLFLGGTYETFYILPIIFTTIGLILFEFKIKAPWYIKVLFPFTYFIFYQYTIVARSYCLVFPMLMLLAIVYDKRFEKPILYSVIMFFFMSISLHTLMISGSLYLIFLIEIFRNKSFKEKKMVVASILLFIELLFTTICTFPASDCLFYGQTGDSITHIVSEATIGSSYHEIIEGIITIAVAIILFFAFKGKEKFEIAKFFIVFLPLLIILIAVRCEGWHIGIVWILLFTYFIVNNQINDNKIIKVFLLFICVVQVYWGISSSIYDWNNKYSASKEVAEFIKSIDYEDKKIYGFNYGITAIQPYFEKNIFKNQNIDKAFYFWKQETGYMSDNEALENKADIYIFPKLYLKKHAEIFEELYNNSQYKLKEFDGYLYMKDAVYETEGYIIFIKNDVKF